jgi:hypothetical protein
MYWRKTCTVFLYSTSFIFPFSFVASFLLLSLGLTGSSFSAFKEEA